jgi:hypothetical protein
MKTTCLARELDYAIASNFDESRKFPHHILYALIEVRGLLDHFPDDEVDEVLIAEIRRRIDCNGERILAVGNTLGKSILYTEKYPEWEWVVNALR